MKTSFTWCLAILGIALLAASLPALADPPPERPGILEVDVDFGPAGFARYAVIETVVLHRPKLPPGLPPIAPFDPDEGEQHLNSATATATVGAQGKSVAAVASGLGAPGGMFLPTASAADMPPRRVEAPQLRSELEAVRRALGL